MRRLEIKWSVPKNFEKKKIVKLVDLSQIRFEKEETIYKRRLSR